MGWLFMEKPRDVKRYFFDKFNWETETAENCCLAISLKLNVCYAAIETTHKSDGRREVWAAVYLLKYVRNPFDGMNFGYKDLTESCGPVQADCPEYILDMLTDTDNENAIEWRARCRANAKKKVPPFGAKVRFAAPIQFRDGTEQTEFTVMRMGKRRKVLRGANGLFYRISRRLWKDRDWVLIQ